MRLKLQAIYNIIMAAAESEVTHQKKGIVAIRYALGRLSKSKFGLFLIPVVDKSPFVASTSTGRDIKN